MIKMRVLSMFKTMSCGKKALSADYLLRIAVCSFFFLFCANTAQSKGIPLFLNWGTEVYIVKEMPDDYMIQTTEYGAIHVNLGVAYDELSLFGIPLWNWNVEKYILLPDDYDTLDKGNYVFYNIDAGELRRVQHFVGELPEVPELSFWRSYGGKLIFLLLILLLLYGLFSPSTDTEEKQ
jgi:hypothetical protein